jgi:Family of unknown function (DUF6496)
MTSRYSEASSRKVHQALHEMKQGMLKSGRSGKLVSSGRQAIAIGLSEARDAGAKVTRPKSAASKSRSS